MPAKLAGEGIPGFSRKTERIYPPVERGNAEKFSTWALNMEPKFESGIE